MPSTSTALRRNQAARTLCLVPGARPTSLHATVERDSCGGCFNQIPAQLQLEITQRKKILACEHCGRVLVDDDIMMVGKEPKVVAVEGEKAEVTPTKE